MRSVFLSDGLGEQSSFVFMTRNNRAIDDVLRDTIVAIEPVIRFHHLRVLSAQGSAKSTTLVESTNIEEFSAHGTCVWMRDDAFEFVGRHGTSFEVLTDGVGDNGGIWVRRAAEFAHDLCYLSYDHGHLTIRFQCIGLYSDPNTKEGARWLAILDHLAELGWSQRLACGA